MRKLIQKKVWVSVITCESCGRTTQFWHHGMKNKKDAIKDWGNTWEGWDLTKGKETCWKCVEGVNSAKNR